MQTSPCRENYYIDIEDCRQKKHVSNHQDKMTNATKPNLIHPGLHDVPQDLRFVITGAINTVGLMLTLWIATVSFKHLYSASTIYTYVNLLYIPVGHAMSSLIVFGWPRQYVKNLLMNAPIGLTATALGSYITGYLEIIAFDALCYEFLEDWNIMDNPGEGGSLFSSVLVMIITGIWGYLLSNFVNSSPKTKAGDKGVKDL